MSHGASDLKYALCCSKPASKLLETSQYHFGNASHIFRSDEPTPATWNLIGIPTIHTEIMAANITADVAATASSDHNAHQPYHTAQTTGSEAPLNPPTDKSDLHETTMTLRSGRIIRKWRIEQQARRRHFKDNVGHNVQFEFANPPDARSKPMSDVFNTPELLEQILLELKPGFILTTAQIVCRGFKQSMDSSPSFSKRRSFAIQIDFDVDEAALIRGVPSYQVNLRPRWICQLEDNEHNRQFNFLLEYTHPSFEKLAAMEGLRRLRVFDEAPPVIRVQWKPNRSGLKDIIMRTNEGGSDYTFGQIFDAVAEKNYGGYGTVTRLWVFWYLRRKDSC